MEELELKTRLITVIVILIWTALQFIMWVVKKILKRRKNQKTAVDKEKEEVDEEKEEIDEDISFLEIVEKVIPQAIKFAEKCGIMSGDAKKLLATSKVMTEMITKGMDYNSHAAEISQVIDDFVDMSKNVNVKNNSNQIKEE